MGHDSRLATRSTELANRLTGASEQSRRQVAATVAIELANVTGVADRQVARNALAAIHAHAFGATPIRDSVESAGHDEEGRGYDAGDDVQAAQRHLIASHALLALRWALGEDSEVAAHEALFEAFVTTKEIRNRVKEQANIILDGAGRA